MMRANSGQRWRSSFSPFCSPATLKGWHGNPPVITSGSAPHRARIAAAVNVRTSENTGTRGQWWRSTAAA